MDWHDRPRADRTAAWRELQAHFAQHFAAPGGFDLRQAFADDPQRFERFSLSAAGVFADCSKNLIDAEAARLLSELARQCGVAACRDALFAGEPVNTSERRPATHVHWRMAATAAPAGQANAFVADVVREASAERERMLAFADAVRASGRITDVVHIGIGGSDLGPRVVLHALRAGGHLDGPRVHFIANMDGHELAAVLPRLRSAATTLFVVVSKSFGTAETRRNAASARDWFIAQRGGDVARHFVAVSARPEAAREFGIETCFGFDEGVGGRYSLWSPVGLSIALAAGRAGFEGLLEGARAMDAHFLQAPIERNLPVQLALLDVWYRNFHGFASRSVAPYHHGLRRLPAYLRQLEMESHGKRVDQWGQPLEVASAAVTWGEVGSNGQHAFFQMLHQGTDVVPVEFVLVRTAAHGLPEHHTKLLANALAQTRALMLGQAGDTPERNFPGNRPSTTLVLPDVTPPSLGALLALYEHRTFARGALWGINSFDQWGVELGKHHSGEIESRLATGDSQGLDASTAGLLGVLRG